VLKALEKTDDGKRLLQETGFKERSILGKPIERQKRVLEQLDDIIERLKMDNRLMVCLCGEGKAGKSTVLNMLLGEEVFKTDNFRSIRALRYISFGPKFTIQVREFGSDRFVSQGEFPSVSQLNQKLVRPCNIYIFF
jgi:type IV secretory pathway VirB4 component